MTAPVLVATSAGALIPPSSRVRATFDGATVAGYAERFFEGADYASNFYQLLVLQLPVRSLGYVATPSEAVPDATALTVDLRTSADAPPLTGAELAQRLNDISPFWELARLELLTDTSGSDQDIAARQAATGATAMQPTMIERVVSAAQSVGKWFLWVLLLLAVILVAWLLK